MTARQEQAHLIMAHIQELKEEVVTFLNKFEEPPGTLPCNYVRTEIALFKSMETFFEMQTMKHESLSLNAPSYQAYEDHIPASL